MWRFAETFAHAERRAIFSDNIFPIFGNISVKTHPRVWLRSAFKAPTVCSDTVRSGWKGHSCWEASVPSHFLWSEYISALMKRPSYKKRFLFMIIWHPYYEMNKSYQFRRRDVLFYACDELIDYCPPYDNSQTIKVSVVSSEVWSQCSEWNRKLFQSCCRQFISLAHDRKQNTQNFHYGMKFLRRS